jgi:plasmid stability protein
MGKTLTIRNIPEDVYDRFAAVARSQHRNAEAHGRFLIEQATLREPLDTCGQLLDAYATLPPPNVAVEKIESYQASRGRRSPRP